MTYLPTHASTTGIDTRGVSGPEAPREPPPLPAGGLAKPSLHVWLRTDTSNKDNPQTYCPHGSVSHERLNQLIQRIGGNHVDLVIGYGDEAQECGLEFDLFKGQRWYERYPSGNGCPTRFYWKKYEPAEKEKLEYVGELAMEWNYERVKETGEYRFRSSDWCQDVCLLLTFAQCSPEMGRRQTL